MTGVNREGEEVSTNCIDICEEMKLSIGDLSGDIVSQCR